MDAESSKHVKQLALRYQFIIEQDQAAGFPAAFTGESRFVGRIGEFPGVVAVGTTKSKCLDELCFALEVTISAMIKDGRRLPIPLAHILSGYRFIIEQDGDRFVGKIDNFPAVIATGNTKSECVRSLQSALENHVSEMIEKGEFLFNKVKTLVNNLEKEAV